MFFKNDCLMFNILDVIELKQTDNRMFNANRHFNALSYRIRSDATLETKNNSYKMTDGTISYIPAELSYNRSFSYDELIVIHFETTDYTSKEIETFLPSDKERLFVLFKNISDCWKSKEIGYKHRCSAIFCEIMYECCVQNYVYQRNNSPIQNSVDYISKNFTSTNLTVKKAAEMSFISEVYFRKLFKDEYGISPRKYIINLRIQYALGLISTGYYSLKEVASMSGYSNYKYFSTEFKSIMGMSPSAYKYNYK